MKIPIKEAHIAKFDESQCRKVVVFAQLVIERQANNE